MSAAADETLMRQAIAAAWTHFGKTRPNPVVGCVVAREGEVLACTVTAEGGRPHAEEQALAIAGPLARGADVFVTLEPCGARSTPTPSCSERLIDARVNRVVVAWEDPSHYASGRGGARLRAAGVRVQTGLLSDEAAPLYRGYAHRLATGRPLVRLSADGAGCEAPLLPRDGEALEAALLRLGAEGFTQVWAPPGGAMAEQLETMGLLDRPR